MYIIWRDCLGQMPVHISLSIKTSFILEEPNCVHFMEMILLLSANKNVIPVFFFQENLH